MSIRLSLIAVVAVSSAASAEPRASLKGRIVFAGTAPKPDVLKLNKDIEFCGKHKPTGEKLLVHAKNSGLKNVVIWLDIADSGKKPPLPPGDEKTLKKPVKLDNAKCRFAPHVCFLRVGQPLEITNSDAVDHSVAVFLFDNTPFNVSVGQKKSETKILKKPEATPADVTCPIHAWMKGWLVVKNHPYVGITDENGRFEIKNLPPGKWSFRIWHEDAGYLPVSIKGATEGKKEGRFTLDVEGKAIDLGDVSIAARHFPAAKQK